MLGAQPTPESYLEQIPGEAHKAFDPYIERGGTAGDIMGGEFGRMSQDPTSIINEIMKKYSASPQYRMEQEAMTRAAGNTAAAGGMRGSSADIGREAHITDRLMGEDMQRWLHDALGVKGAGLSGEQGLYGTGFQASRGLEGDIAQSLSQQGSLAFQRERDKRAEHMAKEARRRSFWGQLVGGITGGMGGYMTGGKSGVMPGASTGAEIGMMF